MLVLRSPEPNLSFVMDTSLRDTGPRHLSRPARNLSPCFGLAPQSAKAQCICREPTRCRETELIQRWQKGTNARQHLIRPRKPETARPFSHCAVPRELYRRVGGSRNVG